MAKGLGIIGNFSGKLGNSVGYIIRNAKSNQTQGIRIYQPTVRNPQTTLQLEQRVKLAAVSNIYKQFRDVIRRSVEGKEYGDASRRAWLKQALGSNFSAGPWLLKGSTDAYPIPNVAMSVGSLPNLGEQLIPNDDHVSLEVNRAGTSAAPLNTVGNLSEALIYEGNVKEGDQVTILAASISSGSITWAPVKSFYVSTASSAPLASVGIEGTTWSEGDYSAELLLYTQGTTRANAVCLITSREGVDGKHLRSRAEFVFGVDALQALVYNGSYKSVAMDSYRTTASQTEDWQVTRGASGEDAITLQTRDNKSVVIVSMTQAGNYLMAVADDGNQYYIYADYSKWNNFHKYYASLSSSTTTAPAGATNANTVADVSGATAAEQDAAGVAFANWFIRNGGSYSAIF